MGRGHLGHVGLRETIMDFSQKLNHEIKPRPPDCGLDMQDTSEASGSAIDTARH